jgi:hypothetical protein
MKRERIIRTKLYVVVLTQRKTGKPFVAHNGNSGSNTFYGFRDAVKFKQQLQQHGMVGKVSKSILLTHVK